MKLSAQVLAKLTTRNILAVATVGMFLYGIYYILTENPELLENPLVTGFIGSFTTVVVMIYVFYFRVSGPQGLTTPSTLDRPPNE